MRFLSASLVCALLLTVFPAEASKIYRWKDADGVVHFGSEPPQDQPQAERYQLRVQPSSQPVENTAPKEEKAAPQVKTETITMPASIDAETAKQHCAQAKSQKVMLSENFNRRYKQEDGTYRPFNDEQRAAKIAEMDKLISVYCR